MIAYTPKSYLDEIFDVFIKCGGEGEMMKMTVFSSLVMIEVNKVLDGKARAQIFHVLFVAHDRHANHLQ